MSLRVRVPATTSNLGPGFDALGLALAIDNSVTAERAAVFALTIDGFGADSLPRDATNVLIRAYHAGCAAVGADVVPMRWHCINGIPLARGLGSSAAAIVAGLTVADAMTQGALGRERVLALASEIEGHPDNAAPAVFGGLQACVADGVNVQRVTVPVETFPTIALFIPDFEMPTHEARAVLPATVSRADAVFNISRAAQLVAALSAREWSALAMATEDALHQRARESVFPAMPRIISAARAAGALGAWLSGAGSTVAAFVEPARAETVCAAMARAAGIAGRMLVTTVNVHGATVEGTG